ncbi:MAG: hypothetical protein ACXVFT_27180 [Solirubrobacteraceae bacterium]
MHATALAQAPAAAPASSVPRIALMVGAALVGAAVGLLPALVLGSALGVLPRPTRARSASGAPERGEQPRPPAVPEQPPLPRTPSEPIAAGRERHRQLYEAEYSWQELRLAALRQRIGAQLAPERDLRKPTEGQ